MKIHIATRKSALALWQANHVAVLLLDLPEVEAVDLVPLSTRGDEILDRSLQKIGGKGLFIKELEVAMHTGEADIAVHSMKDVPAEMPDGFCIAAVLERANHADALVSPNGEKLQDLPRGALVGSSSLRRQAQLKMLRSDLKVEPLRGNVNTRLAKLQNGAYDAIILAAAGLERLELEQAILTQDASLDRPEPPATSPSTPADFAADTSSIRGYELREQLAESDDAALWRAYQPATGREVTLRAFGPEVAHKVRHPDTRDVTLHCNGFNAKNSYDRQTPCDQDFLRKLARTTPQQALLRWFNHDVVKILSSSSGNRLRRARVLGSACG